MPRAVDLAESDLLVDLADLFVHSRAVFGFLSI